MSKKRTLGLYGLKKYTHMLKHVKNCTGFHFFIIKCPAIVTVKENNNVFCYGLYVCMWRLYMIFSHIHACMYYSTNRSWQWRKVYPKTDSSQQTVSGHHRLASETPRMSFSPASRWRSAFICLLGFSIIRRSTDSLNSVSHLIWRHSRNLLV